MSTPVRHHYHGVPDLPVGRGQNKIPTSDMLGVDIYDQGVLQGRVESIDFDGAGVVAAVLAGVATVTIPGGGVALQRVLVWDLLTPWATVDTALDTVGREAIVLVEGDLTGAARLMTKSATDPDGLTDLSGVFFIAYWAGSDVQNAPPPSGALVDWDATPGSEFQIGRGGVLQSKDILWRYGARIGSGAGFMGRLYFDLDGGGIVPQPGYTGDVARVGKPGATSLIKLRNGAAIGDAGLVDAMFVVSPSIAAPPYMLTVGAVSGSTIGPRSFSTSALNPFAPYAVPVVYDGSVRYDPTTAHVNASIPAPSLLDDASRHTFDPTVVGVLSSTTTQGAVDELTLRAITTFVYRPGGGTGGNVYADFNALYDDFILVDGPKIIQFDNSVVSPVIIPPKAGGGFYSFRGANAQGVPNTGASLVDPGPIVQFAPGAQCDSFFDFSTNIVFEADTAIGQPVLVLTTVEDVELGFNNAILRRTAGAAEPFLDLSSVGFPSAGVLISGHQFAITPTAPVAPVLKATGSATIALQVFDSSRVFDVIETDATSFVDMYGDASSRITPLQTFGVPGQYAITLTDDAFYEGYAPTVPGDWAPVPVNVGEALDQLAAAGGGGVIDTFVYTETGAANVAAGVYNNWATMMAAIAAIVDRQVRIMLWSDVTTLPAGLWDFTNVEEWTSRYGATAGAALVVTADDGFRMTAMPNVITGIDLFIQNTVDPVWSGVNFNLSRTLTLNEAHIECSVATLPFIRFTGGGGAKRIKVYGTGGAGGFAINNGFGPGGGELIDLAAAGVTLEIDLFDLLGVSEDSIMSVVGSTLVIYLVTLAGQSPVAGATLATYFSTALGAKSVVRGYFSGGLSTGNVLAVATPSSINSNNSYVGAWVFGDVNLAGDGAANGATINWQVETAVGSGVFTTVQTLTVPPLDSVSRRVGFGFLAPVGRRWQWTAGGLAGAIETVNPFAIMEW